MRPPIRSRASSMVTRRPAWVSARAAASPATPAPTISTGDEEAISATGSLAAGGCSGTASILLQPLQLLPHLDLPVPRIVGQSVSFTREEKQSGGDAQGL